MKQLQDKVTYRATCFPILVEALKQARLYAYAQGQTIDAVERAIALAEKEPKLNYGK